MKEYYSYNLKEIREKREKENILYSSISNVEYCGVCGAKGTVKREIVDTGLLGIREERYRCVDCECTEFIRHLKKDEQIHSKSNLYNLMKAFKLLKGDV